MEHMREIGRRIQAEQNLSESEVAWLITMAQAVLRAFAWEAGQPICHLAAELGVSRQTLYTTLRWVVQAMVWVYRHKASIETVVAQVQSLQDRLARIEQAYHTAQGEIHGLSHALAEAQANVAALQAEVSRLQEQWQVHVDRLIVVLKLDGRCTVRSIVEVLKNGLGLDVSVGYVQGIIAQAETRARTAFEQMLKVIPLSGAICIDEVFFKEMARKVLGVVIVDPLTGLILHLERCTERSADAIGVVLSHFNAAGFKDQVKLCLTDMYEGYLKPIKTYLPRVVHQFCWFHINCFHIGATVHQAERAYKRAVDAVTAFDKKHRDPLSATDQQCRQALVAARDQAHQHWQGALRFQRLLTRLLWSPTLAIATARLDQLIRVAPKVENAYVQKMGTFLAEHRPGLLVFYACLESGQHRLKRLSRSQQQWVLLATRWAVPLTSNAAEHIFRCLRRYTHGMDHFGTSHATQGFFDLFAFYHNVHLLRAGKHAGQSLLAAAHVDVLALFGTDDPYTMLGFPPAAQAFKPMKSVQSVAC
jgi:uncharacterized coiled-coil protein SlyX